MYVPRAAKFPTECAGLGCSGLAGLTMDGSGLFGTGIFGTGVSVTDFSTWGPGEIATALLAGFAVFSVFSTTKRTYQAGRKNVRTARRRLEELTRR